MTQSTLVVIPARGGSKGIPGKNLYPLGGKPLIVWTLERASALDPAQCVVVVSTDSLEIAEVATRHDVRVIMRPQELAQDDTATEPVVEHVIATLTAEFGGFEQVMLLQATSPIRLPATLPRALDQFATTGVDSMVGVVPESPFLWRGSTGHGSVSEGSADYDFRNRPRRQDFTEEMLVYRETGSLYLTRTPIYLAEHNRLGGRVGLFVMDPIEGVDIDTYADLEIAESRIKSLG